MPHLWVRNQDREWAVLPLDGKPLALATASPRRLEREEDFFSSPAPRRIGLLPTPRAGCGGWVLLADGEARVWINGLPSPLGIRVLRDRDEIRTEQGGIVYYSTEELARLVTYPGQETQHLCPRCKRPIQDGDPAVRCPGCGLWHHQDPEKEFPCWTYRSTCACSHPTDLDGWYRWTPEEL